MCPTKLPFYAGYSEIVLRCNATSEVEQPRRGKRRPKQENQNSNGFSYNPTKTLKRCWTRFARSRLQRFSFKKWVGPHPFFEGKALAFCRFFIAPAVAKTGNAIFALISKIFGLLITIKPWRQFRPKYTHTESHRKDIHYCWISSAYLSLILIIPFDHWFIIIFTGLSWLDLMLEVSQKERRKSYFTVCNMTSSLSSSHKFLHCLSQRFLTKCSWESLRNQRLTVFSKIQLVVYYQCCILIGWATTRRYVIAH